MLVPTEESIYDTLFKLVKMVLSTLSLSFSFGFQETHSLFQYKFQLKCVSTTLPIHSHCNNQCLFLQLLIYQKMLNTHYYVSATATGSENIKKG